jgi:Tol biopolymer transport system component
MPAWSPDGTRLVFSRNGNSEDTSSDDIYVMDLKGGSVTPLVVDEDETFGPDWQPLRP